MSLTPAPDKNWKPQLVATWSLCSGLDMVNEGTEKNTWAAFPLDLVHTYKSKWREDEEKK
jgi:hypothetical protein